jgi:hypothetical protein
MLSDELKQHPENNKWTGRKWIFDYIIPEVEQLEKQIKSMKQFIRNGVEFGYIRLPEKDTNDPALKTYNEIVMKE